MPDDQRSDAWTSGVEYEGFIGRWSRPVAARFVRWLGVGAGASWLDFGCGTGALTEAILAGGAPRHVVGCDRSAHYLAHTARRVTDPRASFTVAEIATLPQSAPGFDAIVSGLVLNFVPDPRAGLDAFVTRARPGATIAAYIWDYADGMALLRIFWDAAVALDPAARDVDEGVRFPLCARRPLQALFERAGLRDVSVEAIDAPTTFRDFEDYWRPFLSGQGPAPGYVQGLSTDHRVALMNDVRSRLPFEADGSIRLNARAWAVKGRVHDD